MRNDEGKCVKRRKSARGDADETGEVKADRLSKEFLPTVLAEDAGSSRDRVIDAGCKGEWTDADDLRLKLMAEIDCRSRHDDAILAGDASTESRFDLAIDLSGLDHLNAGALEVLLAAEAELHGRGGRLVLAGVSESLERWFGYAGADVWLRNRLRVPAEATG